MSNHSEGKPSRHTVAERINDAADDDLENTKENKSLHQSGQVPMGEITAIKTISTAIIDSNKTDLKPGTVKDWAEWSLNPLLANVPMFNQYKDLTPDEYNKLLECSAILTAEDKAAAGTLTAALDKTSVHVKNFKRELVKIDPSATSSGYKLMHAILSSEECGRGIYRTSRIAQFNDTPFFNNVSTVEEFTAAANTMLAEFNLLPPDCKERAETNADVKMLLKKMPIIIGEEVNEYTKKIKKREARDLPLKFNYDDLAMMLAADVVAANINTSGTINAAKGGRRICLNCGSPDHLVSEKDANGKRLCTKLCPQCNNNICPGVRGGVCVVHADEMPDIKDIKNAEGRPIPPHIYQWLLDLRKDKRSAPTANMATMTGNAAAAPLGFAMF